MALWLWGVAKPQELRQIKHPDYLEQQLISCRDELETGKSKMKKAKLNKLYAILAVIILECVAIMGALPFVIRGRFASYSFWESSPMALVAFLLLVAGGTLFYMRHEAIKMRVYTLLIIIALLLLTISVVQALT